MKEEEPLYIGCSLRNKESDGGGDGLGATDNTALPPLPPTHSNDEDLNQDFLLDLCQNTNTSFKLCRTPWVEYFPHIHFNIQNSFNFF